MAHFAQVENGVVQTVIVVANEELLDAKGKESEAIGQAFIKSVGLEGEWLQCSYSGSFRGTYPSAGWTYDAELDEFIAPPTPEEVTP